MLRASVAIAFSFFPGNCHGFNRGYIPKMTQSKTFIGNVVSILLFCSTYERFLSCLCIGLLLKNVCPLCGIKLIIALIKVDLPAPFGPIIPTICPSIICKETSCKARV